MKNKNIRNVIIYIIFLCAIISVAVNRSNRVILRKFPYPFKAAIAICSDIDETSTPEKFLEIQKFLNTEKKTIWGKGAGLEIGNSFWMYSVSSHDEFTYFHGLTSKPSESAPIIRDFIKSGYVDAMHSFGNFSQLGGFKREMAIDAFKELDKYNCRVNVWVNHGDRFNTQDIGSAPFYLGDKRELNAYHIDITTQHGIEFFWRSDLTDIIGQDRVVSPFEITKWDWHSPFWSLRQLIKTFIGKYTIWTTNKLITPVMLNDGTKVYSFKRYGFWDRAMASDLADLINPRTLKTLVSKNGYMIIYNHFGRYSNSEPFLPKQSREALYELAKEYRRGQIYVTTTAKLLKYNLIYNRLSWSVNKNNGYFNIVINKVSDEVKGDCIPEVTELQGLTFYTPNAEKTKIFIGKQLIDSVVINAADYTGRESISIPLAFLKFPEKYL